MVKFDDFPRLDEHCGGGGGGVFEISKNREQKIDPITAAYRSLKTRSSKVQISPIISSLLLDFT